MIEFESKSSQLSTVYIMIKSNRKELTAERRKKGVCFLFEGLRREMVFLFDGKISS